MFLMFPSFLFECYNYSMTTATHNHLFGRFVLKDFKPVRFMRFHVPYLLVVYFFYKANISFDNHLRSQHRLD